MKSLICEAGPGCGKSSTIEAVLNNVYAGVQPKFPFSDEQTAIRDWVLDNFPPASTSPNVVVLAFNKSIAEEMKTRLQYGEAKTIHSLGASLCYQNVKNRARRPVDSWKTANIYCYLKDVSNTRDLSKVQREILDDIKKIVSALKDACIAPEDITADITQGILLVREIELTCSLMAVLDDVVSIMTLGTTGKFSDKYDFDDMLYLPVLNGWYNSYDAIVVDESQDLSNGRRKLIMQQDCDHFCFVGDPNQAVYFFAGAEPDSIEITRDDTDASTLPLSTSYRCSKAVVDFAKKYMTYGDLRPSQDAPEGQVKKVDRDWMLENLEEDDLVLCRVNAPIVGIAWNLLRQRKPARIVGRDLGASLNAIVKKIDKKRNLTIPQFLKELPEYFDRQVAILDGKKWNSDEAKARLVDQQDCILLLCGEGSHVSDLQAVIKELFDTKKTQGIRLSSIHRAKGLEAPRVFWYAPENTPHAMCTTPKAIAQEKNLQFVAASRAMKELYLVPAPPKDNPDDN